MKAIVNHDTVIGYLAWNRETFLLQEKKPGMVFPENIFVRTVYDRDNQNPELPFSHEGF